MSGFFARRRFRRACRKLSDRIASLRHADDDILSQDCKRGLDALLANLKQAKNAPDGGESVLDSAEKRFLALMPRRSCPGLRDWLDIFAVALAVAFGIRGLFFQPFKIPTSSMQPTLYGVHYVDGRCSSFNRNAGTFHTFCLAANRAKAELTGTGVPEIADMGSKTLLRIGNESFKLPGTPLKVAEYTNLQPVYDRPQTLCDGYFTTGDHLFVERFSHALFGLKRGDVTVFTTEGIRHPDERLLSDSGFYYIKRLAGLPGDTLVIRNNQLFVRPKGETAFLRIQDLDARFLRLYSGTGGYQGHSNTIGYTESGLLQSEFTVPEDCYFMLGDNTRFSSDSRVWGVVPRKNIIGKAFWVFWPISRRWGIADCRDALNVPTGEPRGSTYPSMFLQ